jgi:iron complex outermembrane receptor protein
MEVSINQLFFYTRIDDPLLLTALSNGYYQYQQPAGYVDTKGLETNIRVSYSSFELHIGYTLADVLQHYGTVTDYPLVARNRVNNTLMYEIEDKIKVGLEAYYYSPQR